MANPNKIKKFINGSPTLTEGLVAYWPLNEASGTRSAYWGEDNLTENGGTIARAAGKFGYAADFDGLDDYLSVADNVRIRTGDIGFTMCAWVNLDTKTSSRAIVTKWNGGTSNEFLWLYDQPNDKFQWAVRNTADTATTEINYAALGSPSTGTWYFVIVWHDPDADQIGIQVNDLQPETASTTGGVKSTAIPLLVGATNSGTPANFMDGKIQHASFWKRVLTATERRDLYLGSAAKAFSPDTGSSLTTRLVSFWKLDEAAGTRRDSYGGNNLTDNATVTSAAGKVGNAGQFTAANLEYLSIADNASLSTGDIDFTIASWVYMDTKPLTTPTIVAKWTTGQREYFLVYDETGDRFQFGVSNDGSATVTVSANNFGSPATATWYFIVAWHDSVNNQIGIQVNNGTANTAAHTTGVRDGTEAFRIGSREAGTAGFWNGRIDEVGFWKKVLSTQEKTDLYNSGNANTYPQAGNGQAMEEIDFATDFPDLLPHGRGIQTFERIAETTLSADAANIDFTSISGKYRHLMISASLRGAVAAAGEVAVLRLNDDATANYDGVTYEVFDNATLSGYGSDGPGISFIPVAFIAGNTAPASSFSAVNIHIPDAPNRSRHKSIISTYGRVFGTIAGEISTGESSGRWRNISQVTGIKLLTDGGDNLLSGSRATLYGIRTHKFLVDQDDTLVENLVGYWKLDETSGTRVDSWGANHLTDNATVTSNPGRYGIAGQFTAATSEYLSIADNASLSTGDIDFTIAAWVYLDTKPAAAWIVAKDGASPNREYSLNYTGGATDRFRFFAHNGATNIGDVSANNLGSPSTATWYFLVAWHDATANTVNIQVNNGTADSAATTGVPADSTVAFTIGAAADASSFFNGRIDEVGFWKKVLTAQERSDLYNNGYGNTLVKLGSK